MDDAYGADAYGADVPHESTACYGSSSKEQHNDRATFCIKRATA